MEFVDCAEIMEYHHTLLKLVQKHLHHSCWIHPNVSQNLKFRHSGSSDFSPLVFIYPNLILWLFEIKETGIFQYICSSFVFMIQVGASHVHPRFTRGNHLTSMQKKNRTFTVAWMSKITLPLTTLCESDGGGGGGPSTPQSAPSQVMEGMYLLLL